MILDVRLQFTGRGGMKETCALKHMNREELMRKHYLAENISFPSCLKLSDTSAGPEK